MEIFLKATLYIHIISGGLALVGGLIAIFSPKGKKFHRLSGKIFYFSMLAVAFTAIVLSIFKESRFLLHIGIMAFYMNVSGFRAIRNLQLFSYYDWLLIAIGAFNGIWMISSANVVLMIFGGISIFLVILDLDYSRKLKSPGFNPALRFARHIRMMLGAYIATSTAFLVVNIDDFRYPLLLWLLPTFLITPLIIYWTRKYSYRKKISQVP